LSFYYHFKKLFRSPAIRDLSFAATNNGGSSKTCRRSRAKALKTLSASAGLLSFRRIKSVRYLNAGYWHAEFNLFCWKQFYKADFALHPGDSHHLTQSILPAASNFTAKPEDGKTE
jgi:hypothetical protein